MSDMEARLNQLNSEESDSTMGCNICSSSIQHSHFSSRWMRELTGVEASNARHFCLSCKSNHKPYQYTRSKVIVSDETLHLYFAPSSHHEGKLYSGDTMHVDYITIPHASISTLIDAFKADFVIKPSKQPLDVVLIAGYRELRMGYSVKEIEDRFRRFADTVLAAKVDGVENTVAISDFMYLPSLAWFPDNGALPANHQGNNLQKIEFMNEVILSINLDNQITEFHRLRKYGIRIYTLKEKDRYGYEHQRKIKEHRFDHWKESDHAQKSTLKDHLKFKLGSSINKYFALQTKW